MLVLDGHVHCGRTLPLEEILPLWKDGNIDGGVLFSPVEEIYDRYDPFFTDDAFYRQSRENVHAYLESLCREWIFAYWFVWNDFLFPPAGFSGIKWHRHAHEPRYNFHAAECFAFIEHICEHRYPVIIEDEFANTLELVRRLNGRTVAIIPHFGFLNGGYRQLKKAGLFENLNVYVDTALASPREIEDFAADYGTDRIIFGSDYPFGMPSSERSKIDRLFSGADREKVFSQNLLSLLQPRGSRA